MARTGPRRCRGPHRSNLRRSELRGSRPQASLPGGSSPWEGGLQGSESHGSQTGSGGPQGSAPGGSGPRRNERTGAGANRRSLWRQRHKAPTRSPEAEPLGVIQRGKRVGVRSNEYFPQTTLKHKLSHRVSTLQSPTRRSPLFYPVWFSIARDRQMHQAMLNLGEVRATARTHAYRSRPCYEAFATIRPKSIAFGSTSSP